MTIELELEAARREFGGNEERDGCVSTVTEPINMDHLLWLGRLDFIFTRGQDKVCIRDWFCVCLDIDEISPHTNTTLGGRTVQAN